MESSYSPVAWVFREVIQEEQAKKTEGQVCYFGNGKEIRSSSGLINDMKDLPKEGIFISMSDESTIRIDRIITLFGKPGAAFDEYDAYGNACMDCMGGYEKEDLENM